MNRYHTQLLLLISLSLPFNPLVFAQEIYKSVDEHGNVTYSDSPSKNSKVVELPTINSQIPIDGEAAPRLFPGDTEEKPVKYKLTISEPANDTAIPPGQLSFSIQASIKPQPTTALTYTLVYDGNEQQTSSAPSFVINHPLRGSHNIAIKAKLEGKTVASSNSITVHVIRPTVSR